MTTDDPGRGDRRNDSVDNTDVTEFLDSHEPADLDPEWVEPQQRVEDSPSGHRYVLGETLGEGGMAVVHQAADVNLNRSVAVKCLRSELTHKDEIRQRFFNEAEILACLDHPGTTPVFEAGVLPEGESFYAMKKVSGQTLRELLDARDPADIKDRSHRAHFIDIFIRACQAVAAAHNQGVIHRDLKPDNIMVDGLGVVYVMDWGLAKMLVEDDDVNQSDSGRTQVGSVMGTPAYMAPEQASGHSATSDRQADVFSLGIILYEILTGVNPFRGETVVESMKGVMYHNPEPPKKLNPRVNRIVSAITMKALDKDPFRRYRSANELAEDVRKYREFLPVSAAQPTAAEQLWNWSHHNPGLAAAMTTLAAVALALMFGAGLQASLENQRVAEGYKYIEQVEERVTGIQDDLVELIEIRETLPEGSARLRLDSRIAGLEAQHDMAEEERMALALAITGFTLDSSDNRARAIVRRSIQDNIQDHMEIRDYPRAKAEIEFAMRWFEGGNIFSFTEEDYRELAEQMTRVEAIIEASEDDRPIGNGGGRIVASPMATRLVPLLLIILAVSLQGLRPGRQARHHAFRDPAHREGSGPAANQGRAGRDELLRNSRPSCRAERWAVGR